MDTALPLPYLVSYDPLMVEKLVIFVVAMLTAIMVSAEGQGFVATLMGDARQGAKDRLHFNVFLHLSLWGSICFFVGGFGWAKRVEIDSERFGTNWRLKYLVSRLSGPMANMLMANIAASIHWILVRYSIVDEVFATIAWVNVSMAIYSLLPLPPLPGGALFYCFWPRGEKAQAMWISLGKLCAPVIVAIFLIIRTTGWSGVSDVVNPLVLRVAKLLLDFS